MHTWYCELWTAFFTEAGQFSYNNMGRWIVNDDLMDRFDVFDRLVWIFKNCLFLGWNQENGIAFSGKQIFAASNSKPQIRINLAICTTAWMPVLWPGLSNKIWLAIFKWLLVNFDIRVYVLGSILSRLLSALLHYNNTILTANIQSSISYSLISFPEIEKDNNVDNNQT